MNNRDVDEAKYRQMVIAALERADLGPSEMQVEGLVATFSRAMATLEEFRQQLDDSTQPAYAFGWTRYLVENEDEHAS